MDRLPSYSPMGDQLGAVLDRNGLRPSRYIITSDDRMILTSEMGTLDIDPSIIVKKERLRPGRMLLVDTVKGRVIDDEELKGYYAARQPYGEWLDSNMVQLRDLKIPNVRVPEFTREEMLRLMKNFGYTFGAASKHRFADGKDRNRADSCNGS